VNTIVLLCVKTCEFIVRICSRACSDPSVTLTWGTPRKLSPHLSHDLVAAAEEEVVVVEDREDPATGLTLPLTSSGKNTHLVALEYFLRWSHNKS